MKSKYALIKERTLFSFMIATFSFFVASCGNLSNSKSSENEDLNDEEVEALGAALEANQLTRNQGAQEMEYSLEGLSNALKRYDEVSHYGYENRAFRVIKDGKYGLIDRKGIEIVPCKYGPIGEFYDNMAIVCDENEDNFGFMDIKGKLVVPISYDYNPYDYNHDFSEGLACVLKDGKCGFINTKGDVVIPLMYDGADRFSEGLAPVQKDGKWGFIDETGNVVIPFSYEYVRPFSEGLAIASDDELYGFIDKKGNIKIPFVYDRPYDFSDDFNFHEGFAMVKSNGEFKFINENGEEKINLGSNVYYNEGGDFRFHEGLAMTYDEEGYVGYINYEGKEVIQHRFLSFGSTPFKNGLAIVHDRAGYQVVDTKGNFLFGVSSGLEMFDEIGEGLIIAKDPNDRKYGYYQWNTGNKELGGYSEAYPFSEGLAYVEVYKNGKMFGGIIDRNGNSTFDYDAEFNDPYGWIQGHWICDGPLGRVHLVIEGDRIIHYQKDPSESPRPIFTIEDGEIIAPFYKDAYTYYKLDAVNQRIQYGEMNGKEYWFRKQ